MGKAPETLHYALFCSQDAECYNDGSLCVQNRRLPSWQMKWQTSRATAGCAHRERKWSPELILEEICLRARTLARLGYSMGNTVVKCACHTRLIPFTTTYREIAGRIFSPWCWPRKKFRKLQFHDDWSWRVFHLPTLTRDWRMVIAAWL